MPEQQSTTTANMIVAPTVPTQSVRMSSPRNIEQLERFAVARLQHHVSQLQTQVENERTLKPPVRKILHLICDETALTANIPELKRFVTDKVITMLVPLTALDSLDALKKGTGHANINAREAIRFFDRAQTPGMNRRSVNGLKIQEPKEKFATWAECVAAAPAQRVETTVPELDDEPPAHVKDVLNCAVWMICQRRAAGEPDDEDVFLVTNDEILKEWAEVFNVPCLSSFDALTRVQREEAEYLEKKRHYEYSTSLPTSPPNGRRSSRGGGGSRGGRGGSPAFARSQSWREEIPTGPMDPNEFRRGPARASTRESSPPDYVLRSPPRGVPRGRGKLWMP